MEFVAYGLVVVAALAWLTFAVACAAGWHDQHPELGALAWIPAVGVGAFTASLLIGIFFVAPAAALWGVGRLVCGVLSCG